MNSRADFIVGVALSLLGGWIYFYAERYTGRGINSYGPNFFPQLLAIMLVVSSLGLLIKTGLDRPERWLSSINKNGFIKVCVTLVLGISYVIAMNYLGFPLSTFLFLYITMMFLGHIGWQRRAIVSLGVTVAVYSIFHLFLKIPVPHGIFEVVL